jgi:hypothetical protein
MGMSAERTSLEEETKEFAARLSTLAQSASKAFSSWRTVAERLDDPERLVRWLESVGPVTDDSDDLKDARMRLLESWREAAATTLLQLEAELRETCKAKGWRLDGEWPEYVINFGVSVHIDEKKRSANVGNSECPANGAAITKILNSQVAALLPKSFSPQRFMEAMLRAYDAISPGKGGQIPLLDVYRSFVIQSQSQRFWRDARVDLFTPTTTEQFRARLSQSLESGIVGANDRELRLLPPLDPKDAIFMYLPAERRFGYIGRIEFVEQARGAR